MFIGKCSCVYCKEVKSIYGIHFHVDRTHLGSQKYSSGNNGKYHILTERAQEKRNKDIEEYFKNPKLCAECDEIIEFDNRQNTFCGRECSATSTNRKRTESGWKPSKEQRKKTSESLTGRVYVEQVTVEKECVVCRKLFTGMTDNFCCSRPCSASYGRRGLVSKSRETHTAFENYRADCQFKFSLKDYPERFEFSLIEQYGWYKAKNRGDNLQGVSRDHMVSVRYGFDNNIDPKIIAHPANCQLIQHGHNVSKGKKCSITVEELLDRIKNW